MKINPVEPSQRQDDSEDDKVAAAVEAVAKQVAAVEEQVAMMAGPSHTTGKRVNCVELFASKFIRCNLLRRLSYLSTHYVDEISAFF